MSWERFKAGGKTEDASKPAPAGQPGDSRSTGQKIYEFGEKMERAGNATSKLGCYLTSLITLPIVGLIIGSVPGLIVGLALGILLVFIMRRGSKPAPQQARPEAPAPERPAPDYQYETYVAGITKRGRQAVAQTIDYGEVLDLEREPDNKHDPNAVALWSVGEKLGYIPERYSRMAAEYLDKGRTVEAVVSDIVDLDEDQYGSGKLGVHITLSFYR